MNPMSIRRGSEVLEESAKPDACRFLKSHGYSAQPGSLAGGPLHEEVFERAGLEPPVCNGRYGVAPSYMRLIERALARSRPRLGHAFWRKGSASRFYPVKALSPPAPVGSSRSRVVPLTPLAERLSVHPQGAHSRYRSRVDAALLCPRAATRSPVYSRTKRVREDSGTHASSAGDVTGRTASPERSPHAGAKIVSADPSDAHGIVG